MFLDKKKMNHSFSEMIIKILHKKTFINSWKKTRWKEKPIVIYGENGQGKTHLAEYILKDMSFLTINSDFKNDYKDLSEYISENLKKKSIKMMFQQSSIKSIIFDDLNLINETNKKLFKEIVEFSKKEIMNPIIYIFGKISKKQFKIIADKCFPINISLSKENISCLTENFIIEKSLSDEKMKQLLIKSGYNFHNIKSNLHFYKTEFEDISNDTLLKNESPKFYDELFIGDYDYIFRSCYSDSDIITLNILENYNEYIFSYPKIKDSQKLSMISNNYHDYCLGDHMMTKLHSSHDWFLLNHIIHVSVLRPVINLKPFLRKNPVIHYNKYISKSINYIYMEKIRNNNSIQIHSLSHIFSLFLNYKENKDIIQEYMDKYNITIEILKKLYNTMNDIYPSVKLKYYKNKEAPLY